MARVGKEMSGSGVMELWNCRFDSVVVVTRDAVVSPGIGMVSGWIQRRARCTYRSMDISYRASHYDTIEIVHHCMIPHGVTIGEGLATVTCGVAFSCNCCLSFLQLHIWAIVYTYTETCSTYTWFDVPVAILKPRLAQFGCS